MSLFPAYATPVEETAAVPTLSSASASSGNFDWLKSINLTAENVNRDTLLFPTFTADDDDKRTVEVNEINKDEDSYKSIKSVKKAKRRKKLEAKAEAEKERVLSASISKRIFTDQFDGAGSLKQSFRIDKKSDRTNLAFTSLAPALVAKYRRKRPLLSEHDQGYRSREKDRTKRYFQHRLSVCNAVRSKFEWKTQRDSLFLPLISCERDEEAPEDILKAERDQWNQRLRESPHDVALWLSFLRFQSQSVISDGFTEEGTRGREKVVFERQLAIVERALELNPTQRQLWLFKLELCKEVWESERLAKEWKQLLFLHPNDVALHKHFLLFFLTKFSNFTLGKYVRLVGKCFATFNKVLEGVLKSHPAPPGMEEQVLEVFVWYCWVLVGAGAQERAVANYQALIELNLFAPPTFAPDSASSLQDKLAFFEPFWDSGLPRFGQPHASGWAQVMRDREMQAPSDLPSERNEEEEECALKSEELQWRNWLRMERLRMRDNWLPCAGAGDGEDPERDVLLDDVAPSLFTLRLPSNRLRLITSFLDLLQGHHQGFLGDFRLRPRRFRWRWYEGERCTDAIPLPLAAPVTPALKEVAERVLRGGLEVLEGAERRALTLYWMRRLIGGLREGEGVAKDTRRGLKALMALEDNRNDYSMLTLYAQFEAEFGSSAHALGALRLLVASHLPWDELGERRGEVGAAYVEYALLRMDTEDVREPEVGREMTGCMETMLKGCLSARMLRAARGGSLSGFDEDWRLVKRPEEGRKEEEEEPEVRRAVVTCLAAREYVKKGVGAAEAIFTNALDHLEKELGPQAEGLDEDRTHQQNRKWRVVEQLHEDLVRVLVAHGNRWPASPFRPLREAVGRALRLFPSAPAFNHLFLDMQARSHLARALRRHYASALNEAPTLPLALFAVLGELDRARNLAQAAEEVGGQAPDGVSHRLRALFEAALRQPLLGPTPLLWRLYLRFEALQGHWAHCKTLVYRAFKHCPWAKVLFVDAIELLPEDMEEFYNLMIEKELRVMAPLEEVEVLLKLKAKLANKTPESEENPT